MTRLIFNPLQIKNNVQKLSERIFTIFLFVESTNCNDIDIINSGCCFILFLKMIWCIQHGVRISYYYPVSSSSASDKEGSLQTRPGTDYFQRNCNPEFTPVDMMDVGSSMTSFAGSGSGSESSFDAISSGGFSRPTSPQGKHHYSAF